MLVEEDLVIVGKKRKFERFHHKTLIGCWTPLFPTCISVAPVLAEAQDLLYQPVPMYLFLKISPIILPIYSHQLALLFALCGQTSLHRKTVPIRSLTFGVLKPCLHWPGQFDH